jgi:hypothetical protein
VPKADIVHLVGAVKEPGAVGGIAVATLAKGTSVILVLNQYNCIGCSPNAPTLELWQLLQMKTVVVACTTVVYALLFSRVSGCQDEIGIACVECSSTQGQGHC